VDLTRFNFTKKTKSLNRNYSSITWVSTGSIKPTERANALDRTSARVVSALESALNVNHENKKSVN
jgi:hypothetical protein